MSRKKKQILKTKQLTRQDVYNGNISCPICKREVSTFRVACFLEKHVKHSDYEGVCPICRK